jgi:hypothetical protein
VKHVHGFEGFAMDELWRELSGTRFTPAEAEGLTGVSTVLQRKWVQLHFSLMPTQHWQWEISPGGHRRFTWSGIQMLMFFRDVTRDLGARMANPEFTPAPNYETDGRNSTVLPNSHVFENDFRHYERGDMFLWRSLLEPEHAAFLTAPADAIPRLLRSGAAGRLYLYNLSSMQREISARARRQVHQHVPTAAIESER